MSPTEDPTNPRWRCIPPDTLTNLGSRVTQGRHAFTPKGKPKYYFQLCVGIMALAARKYRVDVTTVVLMSNHLHSQARAGRCAAISLYMKFVKSRITQLTNLANGTIGNIWPERFSNRNPLDTEAEQAAFIYNISHSVKENLTARPEEWPGLHCAEALRTGKPMQGKVWNQQKWLAIQRANPDAVKRDYLDRPDCLDDIELPLSPLTDWRGDPKGFREYCSEIIENIVDQAVHDRVGQPELRLYDSWYVPRRVKRSRNRVFDARGPNRAYFGPTRPPRSAQRDRQDRPSRSPGSVNAIAKIGERDRQDRPSRSRGSLNATGRSAHCDRADRA